MPLAAKVKLVVSGVPKLSAADTAKKPASVVRLINLYYKEKAKNPGEGRRRGILHPSGLLKCRRSQQYELLFTPKGMTQMMPRLFKIFDNGHSTETRLRHALIEGAKLAKAEFLPSVRMEIPDLWIAGESDGILKMPNGDQWIVDFKTINTTRFSALNKPSDDYVWQFHAYMKGLKVPQTLVYYEDKNNQEDAEFTVPFDNRLWAHMLGDTIMYILKATAKGTLVPRDEAKCNVRECPYAGPCYENVPFDEVDHRPADMRKRLAVLR